MGRREASGRCGGGRVCLAAAPRSGNAKRSAAAGWSENGKSRGTVGCACTLGAPTHCTRWNSGRNGSGEQTSLFARGRMLRGPPGHDPLSPDPLVVAFLSHCCAAAVREKTWYHQVNRGLDTRNETADNPRVRRGVDTTTRRTKMPSNKGRHPYLGPAVAKRPRADPTAPLLPAGHSAATAELVAAVCHRHGGSRERGPRSTTSRETPPSTGTSTGDSAAPTTSCRPLRSR